MADQRYLRGSTEQCPKCGSRKVFAAPDFKFKGYGPGLAKCGNGDSIWEPFDPAQIWDPDDPHCSFKQPCNNCAFRKGSPEREDPWEWVKLEEAFDAGGQFFCHKGVPIEPGTEHGYAYPANKDGTPKRDKLRLCRGYLNTVIGRKMREAS